VEIDESIYDEIFCNSTAKFIILRYTGKSVKPSRDINSLLHVVKVPNAVNSSKPHSKVFEEGFPELIRLK